MKNRPIFLVLVLFTLLLGSCKYDFILPEPVPPIDPNTPVSFATQIVPIFSTGDKCTSCHKTGATSPDLTAANAYTQIVPSLINTGSSENSVIYSYPAPGTGTHTWKKYSAGEAALLLTWINQGAKNN